MPSVHVLRRRAIMCVQLFGQLAMLIDVTQWVDDLLQRHSPDRKVAIALSPTCNRDEGALSLETFRRLAGE
jgi:hypothetical protein